MQEHKNRCIHPALLHWLCSRHKTASRCGWLKSKTWWNAGGHNRKENRYGKTVLEVLWLLFCLSRHYFMCCNEFVRCIPTSFGIGGSVNLFVNYQHNHPLTIIDLLQKCNKKLYSNWLTANIFCETTKQKLFTFQRSSIR